MCACVSMSVGLKETLRDTKSSRNFKTKGREPNIDKFTKMNLHQEYIHIVCVCILYKYIFACVLYIYCIFIYMLYIFLYFYISIKLYIYYNMHNIKHIYNTPYIYKMHKQINAYLLFHSNNYIL